MSETARQGGVLVDSLGKFTFRRALGAKEVRPKPPKKDKQPKKLTPFEEVQYFERIFRERARILEEYKAYEDADGNLLILQNGAKSLIGADDAAEFYKEVSMKRPELPELPVLSQKAHNLQFRLNRQKQERGPAQASPLPHAGNLDAFGNPLKKA